MAIIKLTNTRTSHTRTNVFDTHFRRHLSFGSYIGEIFFNESLDVFKLVEKNVPCRRCRQHCVYFVNSTRLVHREMSRQNLNQQAHKHRRRCVEFAHAPFERGIEYFRWIYSVWNERDEEQENALASFYERIKCEATQKHGKRGKHVLAIERVRCEKR